MPLLCHGHLSMCPRCPNHPSFQGRFPTVATLPIFLCSFLGVEVGDGMGRSLQECGISGTTPVLIYSYECFLSGIWWDKWHHWDKIWITWGFSQNENTMGMTFLWKQWNELQQRWTDWLKETLTVKENCSLRPILGTIVLDITTNLAEIWSPSFGDIGLVSFSNLLSLVMSFRDRYNSLRNKGYLSEFDETREEYDGNILFFHQWS